MDIYNLTQVDTTMDGVRGVLLHGRPLVTPSFETQAEAEAAHKAALSLLSAKKFLSRAERGQRACVES